MEGGESPRWALSGVRFLSDRPGSAGLGTVRPRREAPLLGMHAVFLFAFLFSSPSCLGICNSLKGEEMGSVH